MPIRLLLLAIEAKYYVILLVRVRFVISLFVKLVLIFFVRLSLSLGI